MRRREVVCTLGLLTAGVAGCSTTPRPTPSPPDEVSTPTEPTAEPLEVTEFETANGNAGRLRVDLVVENPTEGTREARLHVVATYGERDESATREISVDGTERLDLSVTVPVDYAEWSNNGGSLEFSFTDA